MEYEIRTIAMLVVPMDQKMFSEYATEIRITDEAAGEFLEVSQCGHDGQGKIAINPEEWPTLRDAIDQMIKHCRPVEQE
mgnify:CR=1 FL=1|jgi:hypothetical protein